MKIELRNINKSYEKLQVLKNINLQFENGIYGLIGPNGAGKSTLIRLIVGAEKASAGSVFADDKNILDCMNDYKMKLGYLPQEFGFYKEFTGREMLIYTGLIKTDMSIDMIKKQADELLNLLELNEKANVKIGKYSGGMKQRLGIAQAFLGNPEVIILDEATVGLDPMQRIKFKKYLKEYAKNKIVILSTHIMSDLQEIADYLCFLKEGSIVFHGANEYKNLEELYLRYFE